MSTPFIAIDVGNSSTKVARFNGASWETPAVIQRHDDIRSALKPFTSEECPCGIASVVPDVTEAVRDACLSPPYIVQAEAPLPFAMAYQTPETLGADRLAAATGAWLLYGSPDRRPVLALTAGTALTLTAMDVRDGEPVLLGGAILPGPELLRRAYNEGTAQLPFVDAWPNPPAIGATTEESLQIGMTASLVDAAGATIKRSSDALSSPPVVVATGGWAEQLSQRAGLVGFVDPTLVFEGIRRLALYDQTVGSERKSASSGAGSRPATA